MQQPAGNPRIPTLPLHLMMLTGWVNSLSAFPNASDALPHWKRQSLRNLDLQKLQESLQDEVKSHTDEVLKGITRYLETPYARTAPEPPCIWRCGSARLLDYGPCHTSPAGEGGNFVLFIPSLINRYYILDLEEDRSLLRYLAAQGHHPLVLDWGIPSDAEKHFGSEAYITRILLPAIDFLHQAGGRPVNLAGYCMGGVFALAAAQLRAEKIHKLALLATPWNFHCPSFLPLIMDAQYQAMLEGMLAAQDAIPGEIIQALFYLTDPFVFQHKFRRFAGLNESGRALHDFLAIEHWVNDGVPMTAALARDCLIGWAQENQLAAGNWQIAGERIAPGDMKIPAFLAMPKNDYVVPQDCAAPLATLLKNPHIISPSAGHVSMIAGNRAKKELWEPLCVWLGK